MKYMFRQSDGSTQVLETAERVGYWMSQGYEEVSRETFREQWRERDKQTIEYLRREAAIASATSVKTPIEYSAWR